MRCAENDIVALDASDPLAPARNAFDLPENLIYLDGNSLGPPSRATLSAVATTMNSEWREDLIRSWNTADWIGLPKRCGQKIAKLIGVQRDEVIVCDSVSVNIFKLASALLAKSSGAIVVHADEFPTDAYIAIGLANQIGADFRRIEETAGPEALNETDGIIIKSLVHYKTAAVANISDWEKAARQKGVSIIWDLSHAAGALDLNLAVDGAEFAVGCGYKYLNGGPGAPAFIFVKKERASDLTQPLSGWMGHKKPFDFSDDYAPADGIERFLCGTPSIISMTALNAALDIFDDHSMAAIEKKARGLSDLFAEGCAELGLAPDAPPAEERRGAHLCFAHDSAYEIVQTLIKRDVIGDFRTPNFMRFGFSPLFLRYQDVSNAVSILKKILDTEEWRKPEYAMRAKVT
ncbi:MAG: aminotransferase class V-fold PLP-dependent enzyme [Marinicaulis sp.]|nr:aminotransferase class V-fold PLP-dependent enzyme [Marinicaulis sp.]